MSAPLVSVLIISYNQQHLIREAVQSCLDQTLDDYEIVISDDGSTDGTPAALRSMHEEHPDKIRLVLNLVNQGITANCNAGLAACTGAYVALMGGDDLLLPAKLAAQVEHFSEDPTLMLSYHPCRVLRDGVLGETVGSRRKDIVRNQLDIIGNFGADMPGPATMVRASAIPSSGFDVRIGTASDWKFFIDVSAHGGVARLKEPLGIYRQHGGNVGGRYFAYSDDFLKTLKLTEAQFGGRPGVKQAVRKGGRRFLLGITFRATEQGEVELARGYARSLSAFAPAWLAATTRAMIGLPVAPALFRRSRTLLKRIV